MKKALEIGQLCPDFCRISDNDDYVRLADYTGRKLVIYFYPKDNTPGCTREAIDFTRLKPEFEQADCTIIGISADPPARHVKFKTKHDLSITLLSDEEHEMLEAFGVWGEKKLYGRSYMGIERASFLIDRSGHIAQIWRKVKVAGHADAVLAAAQALD